MLFSVTALSEAKTPFLHLVFFLFITLSVTAAELCEWERETLAGMTRGSYLFMPFYYFFLLSAAKSTAEMGETPQPEKSPDHISVHEWSLDAASAVNQNSVYSHFL